MSFYFIYFTILGIFCGSVALTTTYILAQTMFLMQDKVSKKDFKIHRKNTPRCGGIAILIAFIAIVMAGLEVHYNLFFEDSLYVKCTTIFYEYAGLHLYIASCIVMFSGVLKDSGKTINFITKLGIQSIGVLYFIVMSHFEFATNSTLYITTAIICYIFLIFTINSMNVIDGINGNAALLTLTISISLCFVAYQAESNFITISTLLLSSIVLIFLFFNYPFGKIFLGDSGAFLLGFCLGALLVIGIWYYKINTLYAISLFSYPLCEIIANVLTRITLINNKPPLHAIKTILLKQNNIHLHFFLYKKFKNTSALIINVCYAVFIYLITLNNNDSNFIIICTISFFIFYMICFYILYRKVYIYTLYIKKV